MRIFLLFQLYFILSFAQAQGSLALLKVSEGHSAPVVLLNDGSDVDKLYIVERSGVIEMIEDLGTGVVAPTPFMDISSRVSSGGERGLLGMTFHPNYPTTPYFYVNYTYYQGNQLKTRVSRFAVTADPDIADDNSEHVIIEVDQPYTNHNAGDIKFGPDGYLYITMGDGGSGGDPDNYSQNPLNLLGTILRLDISGDDYPLDDNRNYKIPSTNPFVSSATHLDEIWTFGWRNPWRFSFDSQTGAMWVADVGQSTREEINYEAADDPGGKNYGWSCKEGFHTPNFNPCLPGVLTDPIYDIPRSSAQSITGGYVYRGTAFPGLVGYYIAADFASGQWWRINAANFSDVTQTGEIFSVTTFGTSVNRELYCATIGGDIYRIMDADECRDVLDITSHDQDLYAAEQEINSTGRIVQGQSITYSSKDIDLNINFEVVQPATFSAFSLGCMDYIQRTQY